MNRKGVAEESLPLDLQIHALEQRLLERRQHIAKVAARFGPRVRARVGSKGMLTAAVGFGVFLHRSTRQNRDHRTWSLVSLLNAAYASSSLVMAISSWIGPAARTQTSADRPPFQS
jgi:hypothetical protein